MTKDGNCPVTPLLVEYSPTEMGRDLLPVFYEIMNRSFHFEKELYGEK